MRTFTQILKDNFKSFFTDFLFTRFALVLLLTFLLGVIVVLLGFIYPLSLIITFPLDILIINSLIDWEKEHNKHLYY